MSFKVEIERFEGKLAEVKRELDVLRPQSKTQTDPEIEAHILINEQMLELYSKMARLLRSLDRGTV